MRPLAVSAAARAALASGDAVVVAAHRHGASVAVPGVDDALFVSAPGAGLLPAHVVVRADDLARLLEAARPGAVLRFDIGRARTFRPAVRPQPGGLLAGPGRANVAAVARLLRALPEPLGLGERAAVILAPEGAWCQRVAALQRGASAARPALRHLVGRGAGSTPAGDDFLVGALAHAWLARGADAPLVAAMDGFRGELAARTTTTSATYLRAAARGEFGSHLVAWVRALPRASEARVLALAGRVADHGATSGLDTLVGFVAAAEAAGAAWSASAFAPARRHRLAGAQGPAVGAGLH